MSGLVILSGAEESSIRLLAQSAPEARVASLEHFPQATSARDIAVAYFDPMVRELRYPRPGVLVLPRPWPSSLPVAMRRVLERTALTLGVVVALFDPARPEPPGAVLAPLQGGLNGAVRGAASPLAQPSLATIPGAQPCHVISSGLTTFREPLNTLLSRFDREWAPPGPGAGSFRPGVALLVAEKPNNARLGTWKHRLPFVTFGGTGVGPWLSEQLESAQIREEDLYWINAYDALLNPTSSQFVSDLYPRRIIALGKLAERWCSDAGLTFRSTTTPQYWRRFQSKKQYPLLNLLQ